MYIIPNVFGAKMQSDNKNELIDLHSARGEMYAFLGRVYANVPNDEFYQMLEAIYNKLEILVEQTNNEKLSSGVKGLKAFLEKRNSLQGEDRASFDMETLRHYTTLLGLTTSIPTDESIYTSVEHREKMDAYDKMINLFKYYGYKKRQDISENEDFISYELLFMSHLAYSLSELIKKGDNETYEKYFNGQISFHSNHFDKWIYEFFRRVEENNVESERLYKYLAQISSGFIQEDKLLLNELASSDN